MMKKATKENVLEIINSVQDLEISEDQYDDNLLELGVDSIKFIQIIVSLEEEFECEIPDEKLLITEMDTVQKITGVLQALYDEQCKE